MKDSSFFSIYLLSLPCAFSAPRLFVSTGSVR
jgi:hypothetical protein